RPAPPEPPAPPEQPASGSARVAVLPGDTQVGIAARDTEIETSRRPTTGTGGTGTGSTASAVAGSADTAAATHARATKRARSGRRRGTTVRPAGVSAPGGGALRA
ncbi:hypothetical protein MXD61_02200, partial [Frankia sp. AgPm24]|nr:hypothetical protein [Frankia sp. AgPm24]